MDHIFDQIEDVATQGIQESGEEIGDITAVSADYDMNERDNTSESSSDESVDLLQRHNGRYKVSLCFIF